MSELVKVYQNRKITKLGKRAPERELKSSS